MQAMIFEAFAHLGPILSAILAGFAFYWMGQLYVTPCGEAYLSSIGIDGPIES